MRRFWKQFKWPGSMKGISKSLGLKALCLGVMCLSISSCSDVKDVYGNTREKYRSNFEDHQTQLDNLNNEQYINSNKAWKEHFDASRLYFGQNLYREYQQFAYNLDKDAEYTDATKFHRKAVSAKKGDPTLPEDPGLWHVKSESDLQDLRNARLQLVDAISGYTPMVDPTSSAKAIVFYDCWVQQSQQKPSQYNKDNCRKYYETNYKKIAEVSDHIKGKNVSELNDEYHWVKIEKPANAAAATANAGNAQMPPATGVGAGMTTGATAQKSAAFMPGEKTATKGKTKGEKTATTETAAVNTNSTTGPLPADKTLITDQSDKSPDLVYIAYFDKGSDQLSDTSKAELDKAAAQITKNSPKTISVNGHTDRSIGSNESLVLSKKRADAARAYLVTKGISKDLIHTYGFGKTDNLVDNKEGEEAPANNRAEIVFKGTAQ